MIHQYPYRGINIGSELYDIRDGWWNKNLVALIVPYQGTYVDLTNNLKGSAQITGTDITRRSTVPGEPIACPHMGTTNSDTTYFSWSSVTGDNPASLTGARAVAISWWAYIRTGVTQFAKPIVRSTGAPSAGGFSITHDTSGGGIFFQSDTSTWFPMDYGNFSEISDRWANCCIRATGIPTSGTASVPQVFYIDGVQEATRTATSFQDIPSTATTFSLGNWSHTSDERKHYGWLGPIMMWADFSDPDWVLPVEAVQSLYNPSTRWDMLKSRRGLRMFDIAIPSIGGSTFNKTASETLSFTETGSEIATFVETISETLTFGDTSSETLGEIVGIVDDALTFADTSSEVATFARQVSDVIAFSDTAEIATKVLGLLCSETLSLVDTATATGGIQMAGKGGSSLTEAQMRRLERLQMIQRDDEEVILALMEILK